MMTKQIWLKNDLAAACIIRSRELQFYDGVFFRWLFRATTLGILRCYNLFGLPKFSSVARCRAKPCHATVSTNDDFTTTEIAGK